MSTTEAKQGWFRSHFSLGGPGLSFRDKLVVSLPLQALSLSNVLIHNVYIKVYTDVIGLDAVMVSYVYFIFNIWNMLNDPFIGIFLDKMKYRKHRGKFLYVMRVSVPFMVVMVAMMLFAQADWGQWGMFWWLLVALFIFDTAGTFFSISAGCYQMLIAPTKAERADISVIGGYVSNIVSFFASLIPTLLLVGEGTVDRTFLTTCLLGVVVLNTILYIIPIVLLKDKKELYEVGDSSAIDFNPETLWTDVKSIITMRSFWCTFFYSATSLAPMAVYYNAFLYYMDYVVKAEGWQATVVDTLPMLCVFAVYPLIGSMVKSQGTKMSMAYCIAPYIIGFVILYFADSWLWALVAYIPIMGGKYIHDTAMQVLNQAIIDENEMKTGVRKAGLFSAVRAILNAPFGGIQLIIFTNIIEAYGFKSGGGEQTESAIEGIRIATCGVPILFILVSIIPLVLLPYTQKKELELSAYSESRRHGDVTLEAAEGEPLSPGIATDSAATATAVLDRTSTETADNEQPRHDSTREEDTKLE
ncbi:MAG: MFS transporter [Propionibacteriaceae bacterium]|jgi:GPH family glycoside/pentoside/hexuronide:cation symporter|nr:MFS transporter [Propionibacteriaceae bacterium]